MSKSLNEPRMSVRSVGHTHDQCVISIADMQFALESIGYDQYCSGPELFCTRSAL